MILPLLLLLTSGDPVVEERLTRAEVMAQNLDLDEARDQLLELVGDARASDDQLRRAHLLAGEVDRILGRDVDARMHFFWVLSRDPAARLPEGKPPKVTTFFELVRAEVQASRPREVAPSPLSPPSPSSPPPPPPPSPPPAADHSSSSIVPAAVTLGAGAVAAAAAIPAALLEARFASDDLTIDERESTRTMGVVAWSVVGASGLAAVVAGAWWAFGE